MIRIWLKSCAIAALATVVTHCLSFGIRLVVDKPADAVTLILATLLPILVALPISLVVMGQGERLRRAYAALAAANEALSRKASRDHLTGVLNRESFLTQVEVARLAPDGGTLLMIDVDHFKSVNDNYGHATGDVALAAVARAITEQVRQKDVVARVGGEEFAVFLVGADMSEALQIAQRVRSAVERTELPSQIGETFHVTISVGGARANGQPSLSILMQEADARLYAAKHGGRNRVRLDGGLSIVA